MNYYNIVRTLLCRKENLSNLINKPLDKLEIKRAVDLKIKYNWKHRKRPRSMIMAMDHHLHHHVQGVAQSHHLSKY
jgi:hypothetical protein